jgi:hypothetical protein
MKLSTNRLFATVVVFTTLTACNSSSSDEKIDLQLNLKKGDEHIIVSETTTEGNSMDVKNIMAIKFRVDSVAENEFFLTANVMRIQSEMKMGEDSESYDSQKDPATMTSGERSMHREFAALLESPLTISIDKKGKVVKPFKFTNGETPEEPPIDMSAVQIPFPDHAVKSGDEWTSERPTPLTSTTTKVTYKIKEIAKDKIIVKVEAAIAGVNGLLEDNKAEGEYVLDRASGRLLSSTMEMKLKSAGGKVIYKIFEK